MPLRPRSGFLRVDWPLWVAAMIGAGLDALCFYPGAMSFDSAVIWSQVRGAPSDNIHGVGLLWLWRATETIWSGPTPVFLIQLALLWGGLALISQSLRIGIASRIAFVYAAACAPVVFVLFAHVWSDVMLCATLAFACAAVLRYRETSARGWAVSFLFAIFFALTLRHNALPAILPLLVYFVYLWKKATGRLRYGVFGLGGATIAIALVLATAAALLDHRVDRSFGLFPATALWDLAAISIDTDTLVLPDELHRPELTVADLRGAFQEYSNVSIFTQTHGHMIGPFFPSGDALDTLTRQAWLAALIAHPDSYLAHRWRVTSALFGRKPLAWPHELIYVDAEVSFRDNPPIPANAGTMHALCMRAIEALRDSILLAAWPYLALALAACVLAWRRRRQPNAQAALAILISGLLYAAPLPLVAPSAELRYLGWTCLAAVIGAMLVLTSSQPVKPSPS